MLMASANVYDKAAQDLEQLMRECVRVVQDVQAQLQVDKQEIQAKLNWPAKETSAAVADPQLQSSPAPSSVEEATKEQFFIGSPSVDENGSTSNASHQEELVASDRGMAESEEAPYAASGDIARPPLIERQTPQMSSSKPPPPCMPEGTDGQPTPGFPLPPMANQIASQPHTSTCSSKPRNGPMILHCSQFRTKWHRSHTLPLAAAKLLAPMQQSRRLMHSQRQQQGLTC